MPASRHERTVVKARVSDVGGYEPDDCSYQRGRRNPENVARVAEVGPFERTAAIYRLLTLRSAERRTSAGDSEVRAP